MLPALAIVLSYLVGGVLFGPLVAKRAGVELRDVGSGNPGATNVQRALGKRAALVVLLLDASKGVLAVLFARLFAPGDPSIEAVAGFAAVFGHCYPMGEPSGGGKGVSTALGVLAVLDPRAALAALVAYVLARKASGYGSVASLVATALGTAIAVFDAAVPLARGALVVIAVVIFARHRDNLRRLARGEEIR